MKPIAATTASVLAALLGLQAAYAQSGEQNPPVSPNPVEEQEVEASSQDGPAEGSGQTVQAAAATANPAAERTDEAKWDVMALPSQLEKDYYSIQVANDIASMLSILQTVLNVAQIQTVFAEILKEVSKILLKLYGALPISSYIPAQRVKNDIQQLVWMLREKVSTNLQEYVEDLEEELNTVISIRCQPYLDSS